MTGPRSVVHNGVRLGRAVALAAGVAACYPVRVHVLGPPPPPLAEVVSSAPGPGYVWVTGYYHWDGAGYVWVPGRWVLPPPGRHAWVPGMWVEDHGRYVWRDGHWR
jgi:WXXGXW repeat (2 copies)